MNYLSKLLGTALGTLGIFNAISEVSLAASKNFSVDTNYNNDLCIVVGPIVQKGSFRVFWGSYEGSASITGDGGNKRYGLALYARGNNYPQMTIYYDDGLRETPYLAQESCGNKGLETYWLNWQQR